MSISYGMGEDPSAILGYGLGYVEVVLSSKPRPSGTWEYRKYKPKPRPRYWKPIDDTKPIRIPIKKDKKKILELLKYLELLGLIDYLDDIEGLTLEELKEFIEKVEKEHKPLFEIFLEIFSKRIRKEKIKDPILREKLLKWLTEKQKKKRKRGDKKHEGKKEESGIGAISGF